MARDYLALTAMVRVIMLKLFFARFIVHSICIIVLFWVA